MEGPCHPEASLFPNTDPVATLVPKKKTKVFSLEIDGEINWGSSPLPQGSKEQYIHGGRQWQCRPNTALSNEVDGRSLMRMQKVRQTTKKQTKTMETSPGGGQEKSVSNRRHLHS